MVGGEKNGVAAIEQKRLLASILLMYHTSRKFFHHP
jgi:hypothetical protein